VHELLRPQIEQMSCQAIRRHLRNSPQQRDRHVLADHGRDLQQRALLARQPVNA
jgi:hypothetical protein